MVRYGGTGFPRGAVTPLMRRLLPVTLVAAGGILPLASPGLTQAGNSDVYGLAVSVGYANSQQANAHMPVPWQGDRNVIFIGSGPPWDGGAIRLDNTTLQDIRVNSVVVHLRSAASRYGDISFNLWGSFTVPADKSVILTETENGDCGGAPGCDNFDTSDYPVTPCNVIATSETPSVVVDVAGEQPVTLEDTGRVLDTGGYDPDDCHQSESRQWRPIGTSPENQNALGVQIAPGRTGAAVGQQVTLTAVVLDAASHALANVPVMFAVIQGPDSGKHATTFTDVSGRAVFSLRGTQAGTDVVQARVTNATCGYTLSSSNAVVTWSTSAGVNLGAKPVKPGHNKPKVVASGTCSPLAASPVQGSHNKP